MKKVLWCSRHQPLPVQISSLRRLFGVDVEIAQDCNPFANAEEIKRRFEMGKFDDMVVVAPLWVIYRLTEFGIKPLWAEMLEVTPPHEHHLRYNGRFYFFNRFRRITGVEITFEDFEQ